MRLHVLDKSARTLMNASLIRLAAHALNAALTLNRVALGTLLAVSEYNKRLNASSNAMVCAVSPIRTRVVLAGSAALMLCVLSAAGLAQSASPYESRDGVVAATPGTPSTRVPQ